VTVQLLDNNGNILETQITSNGAQDVDGDAILDPIGFYRFRNLPAGNYQVRVLTSSLPPSYASTGDPDGGADNVSAVILPNNTANVTQDFGYRPPITIGDRVWYDLNGDTVQDLGEPGIPGVTVQLFDGATLITSTTTDSTGAYLFTSLPGGGRLPDGNYTVRIVPASLPPSLTQTFDLNGGLDNAANTGPLVAGDDIRTLDFGYQATPGELGNYVWFDVDADGVQDPTERGIPGVRVELYLDTDPGPGQNFVLQAFQLTDPNGLYLFTGLAAGDYQVRVVNNAALAGLSQTYDLDDGLTPFATLNNSGTVTLSAATPSRYDLDFGYQPAGVIGDFIWLDIDGDGNQDGGAEVGLPNVVVSLFDNTTGALIATTTTDSVGRYTFTNLPAGTYRVEVATDTLPPGVANTGDPDGGFNSRSVVTLATNGAINNAQDFGYRPPITIGDRVWYDLNGDTLQTVGEPGIPGVTVVLRDALDTTTIATVVTDANGNYLFTETSGGAPIPAGSYLVRVTSGIGTPLEGLSQTFDLNGSQTDGQATTGPLDPGATRRDLDFGYTLSTGYIGDYVWYDVDNDGVQDGGIEAGIPGVTVELYRDTNPDPAVFNYVLYATDTTNAGGRYEFPNLPPGNYSVRVVPGSLPSGLTQTYDFQGGTAGASANRADLVLPTGGINTQVDFGYRPDRQIGDRVWANNDGDVNGHNGTVANDDSEIGLPGVTVQLFDATGNTLLLSTVTNANGTYNFSNVPPGNYIVRINPTTLPAGVTQNFESDGTQNGQIAVDVTTANNLNADFGYTALASVGDRVWFNTNNNALGGDPAAPDGEFGIPGVIVELRNSGGVLVGIGNLGAGRTTTDANGNYLFTGVPPVTPGFPHQVNVVTSTIPFGYSPNFDGDGVGTPNVVSIPVLNAGDNLRTVDFGYNNTSRGGIGDRVWYDSDADDTQDPTEAGIPNVLVELYYDNDPSPAVNYVLVGSQVTGDDGSYYFGSLPPGDYQVRVNTTTLPGGLDQTYDLNGSQLDHTATLSLAQDEVRTDVDFGYRPNGAIGDRLWRDNDGDGAQDSGELGISNITVRLYDNATNILIATTVTNTNGIYNFANLPAGSYRVEVDGSDPDFPTDLIPSFDLNDGVIPPGGTAASPNNSGAITLNNGQIRADVDFGYEPTASLGDRVWLDSDEDGNGRGFSIGTGANDNDNEVGIPGVRLNLFRTGDVTPFRTTVTGTDGAYLFTNLPATNTGYRVEVDITTLPPNLGQTYDLDGLGTANRATVATLGAGENRRDVDFGYSVRRGFIGDTLWFDRDSDGLQDAGEVGIPNVTVELYQGATLVGTTVTDANGVYSFPNLALGNYEVRVLTSDPDFPTSIATQTSDRDNFNTDLAIGNPSANRSGTISLTAGNFMVTDADFGYLPVGIIGNRLWINNNRNAVGGGIAPGEAADGESAGEPGIPNVTVNLYLAGSNTLIASTSTAADGTYLFQNLPTTPAGILYRVEVDTTDPDFPANVVPNFDRSTTDPLTVDGPAATLATPHQALVNLTDAARDRRDVDFGYEQTISIGDRVWYDVDNDTNGRGFTPGTGPNDTDNEPGIPGVTVQLFDGATLVATTTTDGNGAYLFTRSDAGLPLAAGIDYRVVVSNLPPGLAPTYDFDGTGTANQANTGVLAAAAAPRNLDFGYRPLVNYIGDTLWYDINANDLQDVGEAGIPGVTVGLYQNNVLQRTTVTNANGVYNFTSVPPGTYEVRVDTNTLPTGLLPTWDLGEAVAPGLPGGAPTSPHISAPILMAADTIFTTADFGYLPNASIGDRVWRDLNGDGVQNTGEPGINGVVLELVRINTATGNVIASVATRTTAGDGDYLFANLPPTAAGESYQVRVISGIPNTLTQTYDLDGLGTPNRATVATLAVGENRRDVDFGYTPNVTIGNRIWNDVDNDGQGGGRGAGDDLASTDGEPGFPGITVQLRQGGPAGPVIASTVTDGDGYYTFPNFPPGQYTVTVLATTLPPGFVQTTDPDNTLDSQTTFTINPGTNRVDVDFGYRRVAPTYIGDYVWYDVDGDGVQDGGIETGIPGVTVRLFNITSGNYVGLPQVTNASGGYAFVGFPPGNYRVEIDPTTLPGGLVQTYDRDDETAPFTTPNQADVLGLQDGDFITDVDFGYQPNGRIGDTVSINDGTLIPGVEVFLLGPNGQILARDITDAAGQYRFDNLPPGTYTVVLNASTVIDPRANPVPLRPFSDADGGGLAGFGDYRSTVTLGVTGAGVDQNLGQDFVFREASDVGVVLWYDTTRDDIAARQEQGIAGAVVELVYAPTGEVVSTTRSNEVGFYLFTELPAGNYIIRVTAIVLADRSIQVYEFDASFDRNTPITLGWGQSERRINYGFFVLPLVESNSTGGIVPGNPPIPPTRPGQPAEPWEALPVCPQLCVQWSLYHTNQTGDWEVFRLGDLGNGLSGDANLSQGKGEDVTDLAPTRSPNAQWIAFSSNRDGNWEIYLGKADGSEQRRVTRNTIAIDTDPVWGPGNLVAFESTRDGNWELYLVDMATGVQQRLTDNTATDINAFWSPDGSKLLFQSDRSGQWQLYELDLATGFTRRLSDGQGQDFDPQYSTTGDRILFRSIRGDSPKSVLHLSDADGRQVTPVSDPNADAMNAAWSPDSSLIAYQSDLDGDLDIYIYQVSSGETRLLTDNDLPDYAPSWLCGSTEVLFTSEVTGNPDIFQAQTLPISAPAILVEEAAEQLTTSASEDIYPQNTPTEENASQEGRLPGTNLELQRIQTDFLPRDTSVTPTDPTENDEDWLGVNGCTAEVCREQVIYHSQQTGDWEIFEIGLDGSGQRNLSRGIEPEVDDIQPTRSPDGRWIAFVSNRDNNWEIYVAEVNGSIVRQVTDNAAADTDPVWAPSSTELVFQSNREGNLNLYSFDLITGQLSQLTFSLADESNAFWSPRGEKMLFQSNEGGRSQIYLLDFRTGATKLLSDGEGADSDPVYSFNGELIAFVRDGEIIFLMNEDGSGARAISELDGQAANPAWSIDSSLLAYESNADGDRDIYVYDLASEQTRLLTGNSVPDYAPTWVCSAPMLVFTSEVDGNPNLFSAEALPIDAGQINVSTEANRLTTDPAADVYPQNAAPEENASFPLALIR
jgi:Tol biopolymer transport system component/protocatechuate 3,4-dioxygenase beta subunit